MRSSEPSNVITVLNLFFCLRCSSRGFLVLTESNKNLEKPKKQKIADPNSPACAYMGLAISFSCFFFSRFFGFWPKVSKTSRQTQKNCRPNYTLTVTMAQKTLTQKNPRHHTCPCNTHHHQHQSCTTSNTPGNTLRNTFQPHPQSSTATSLTNSQPIPRLSAASNTTDDTPGNTLGNF